MNDKLKKIIRKKNKSKIVCLTAYSKNIASILDNHCDIILVGDSLGSVLYNYKTTRNVTLNTMIEHSKSVKLGVQKSLMIVDMPYNTYRTSKQALKNAKLIIKKTKCDGVKLEGGNKILREAKILESSGVFSIVLECVEKSLAKEITSSVKIPTIGIGSSVNCDGQVLVTDDLLGLNPINLRFLKKYSNLRNVINTAVSNFKKDVKKNKFPTKKYSY